MTMSRKCSTQLSKHKSVSGGGGGGLKQCKSRATVMSKMWRILESVGKMAPIPMMKKKKTSNTKLVPVPHLLIPVPNDEKTGSTTLVPVPHLRVPVPSCVNGLFEEPFLQIF